MTFLQNLLLFGSCMGQQAAADGTETKGTSWWVIVIYLVIFGAIVYFLMIRPQRKQKKQQEEKMTNIEPGDSVLTTSGFYGTIVAINGDTVIVEFGNNKNCRIPMSKQAISQVEKANAASIPAAPSQSEKKFFGRKIFISAPIHHHLQAKGWEESKIVMRFWVIGGVMALIGIFMAMQGVITG